MTGGILRTRALLLAALGAASLGGCTFRVDSARVFAPPSYAGPNGERPTGLYGEGDLSKEPLRARVTHGFLGGEARLAFSMIERSNNSRAGAPSLRPLIVHCFGNASTRWATGWRAASKALPFGDVFLFDYPGYGESDGVADLASFEAMRAPLISHLRAAYPTRDIVYWGHSLGGWACSALAATDERAVGLVLETTADNVREVARAWTPWYAKPFIRFDLERGLLGYDNSATLADFRRPVIVLGAARDNTLPVKLHRSLARQLKAAKLDVDYVEFRNAGHGNVPRQEEFAAILERYFAGLGGSVRGPDAPAD